jgi:hypothetical protein
MMETKATKKTWDYPTHHQAGAAASFAAFLIAPPDLPSRFITLSKSSMASIASSGREESKQTRYLEPLLQLTIKLIPQAATSPQLFCPSHITWHISSSC